MKAEVYAFGMLIGILWIYQRREKIFSMELQ